MEKLPVQSIEHSGQLPDQVADPEDRIVKAMKTFLPVNPNTASAYKRALGEYLEFSAGKNIPPASADTLKDFLDRLADSGNSARTVNVKMHGIKGSILHAARELGISEKDFAALKISLDEIKSTKIAPTLKAARSSRILSKDEKDRVVSGCSRRTGLFIEFLFTTGCRVSEMINARWDRVAVRDDAAEIQVTGKGKKARKVIIPLPLLLDIRAVFNGAVYLFESSSNKRLYRHYVSNEISKAVKRTLKKTASAHDLRHSFVTAMIVRGRPDSPLKRQNRAMRFPRVRATTFPTF